MTKEEIIKNYNIDFSKLKRNYIKYPLKHRGKYAEIPIKDDLVYLYISCNMNKLEISIFFEMKSISSVNSWLKLYNIIKSKELWRKSIIASLQKKTEQNLNYQNKKLQKRKQTCLKKYGVENCFQSQEKIEKIKLTLIKNYGVDNPSKSNEIKRKKENTCLKHFGVTNASYSKPFKSIWKDKNKVLKIKEKEYETKRKNNTFKKSKQEDQVYQLLLNKFNQVKRQYSSEKYPFACDFYIPELDLYIEYQGTWTHGKEPYDRTNKEHINIIKIWKNKAKENNFKQIRKNYYLNAIQVWTKIDPLKRQTAKENDLNWIEFFNMDQFMEWYNQILS